MHRNRHLYGTRFTSPTTLALLGSLIAVAACSDGPAPEPNENVGSSEQALLGTACTYNVVGSVTTLNLTVGNGEIGYVGKTAGCTTEPCVYANAKDSSGNLCVVNSTTGKIVVAGAGSTSDAEKMVFDFTNGIFGLATTSTPLMSVSLDGPTTGSPISRVMVISPAAGSNMAMGSPSAGLNLLDINVLTTRGSTQYADLKITGASGAVPPAFELNGNAGPDIFTGDVAGWSTIPTGWATATVLGAAIGTSAASLNMTVSGGPGNDTLAGGAGSNTLVGGAGNDIFLQSATARAETILGGDGVDTVDYSARTASVYITPNSDSQVVTFDVDGTGTGYVVGDVLTIPGATTGFGQTLTVTSVTAGAVTAATLSGVGDGYALAAGVALTGGTGTGETADILSIGPNDGASGEGDSIGVDVEIMIGGAGNDILNAHAIPASVGATAPAGAFGTSVVLIGGAGNDQLTGGPGNDDLCGGTGNDTFYENAGNDNLVGGAGLDTVDYSGGAGVVACLGMADATCTTHNGGEFTMGAPVAGGTPEVDVMNTTTVAHVCPSSTLYISQLAGYASVAPTTPGSAMAVDVENVTGSPSLANTLHCGTLACTVFGGTGTDIIVGSTLVDQIFGQGGEDAVSTNGGDDLVDLTHAATAPSDCGGHCSTETVNCDGAAVTVLVSGGDTMTGTNCSLANLP